MHGDGGSSSTRPVQYWIGSAALDLVRASDLPNSVGNGPEKYVNVLSDWDESGSKS